MACSHLRIFFNNQWFASSSINGNWHIWSHSHSNPNLLKFLLSTTRFGQWRWTSMSFPAHFYWSKFSRPGFHLRPSSSFQHLVMPLHFCHLPPTHPRKPLCSAAMSCSSCNCNAECKKPKILALILDLDGTLLDTGLFYLIHVTTPFVFAWWVSLYFCKKEITRVCMCGWLCAERATRDVLKDYLAKYGKVLEREENKRLGMTLKDSATAIVEDYDLPLTPDQYINEIIPMYREK